MTTHEPDHMTYRMAWSVRELSECYGLHPDTIYREIHAGRLEAVKVRGRTIIFHDAVNAWRAALPRFGHATGARDDHR